MDSSSAGETNKRLRLRVPIVGAVLIAVALIAALGGFDRAPVLDPADRDGAAFDAGEYSIRFQQARVRAATTEERDQYASTDGGPIGGFVEVDVELRNQSDRDAIYLSPALEWLVDGTPLPVDRDLLSWTDDRRDLPGQFGHPRGIWVPLRLTLELSPAQMPIERIGVIVHAIEYEEFGDAFANIIGFKRRREIGTVTLDLDQSAAKNVEASGMGGAS